MAEIVNELKPFEFINAGKYRGKFLRETADGYEFADVDNTDETNGTRTLILKYVGLKKALKIVTERNTPEHLLELVFEIDAAKFEGKEPRFIIKTNEVE